MKKIGEKLSAADKLNFVVPNTVKRVLHILRESCKYYKIDQELSDKDNNQKMSTIENMQDFGKKNQGTVDDFDFSKNLDRLQKGSFASSRKTMATPKATISRSMTISDSMKADQKKLSSK